MATYESPIITKAMEDYEASVKASLARLERTMVAWLASLDQLTAQIRGDADPPQENPACTCKPECEDPCKGECGCEACWDAYMDHLSSDYD